MSSDKPAEIGRYRVIRALGEGGMGTVYLARDPAIDRLVAIKLMRGRQDNVQMRERFSREARAIGRLHHPNIVTIFDVGDHQGEPFIAMEYVEGQTLANLVGRTPDLPLPRKLTIVDGLSAGLHYAHTHGIVHRDIKPANVMIDAEGRVKILDFGIARSAASGLTQTGTLIGTLNYMSPEQLMGRSVDPRSDIFAVGAVFYETLSGRPAFPGEFREGLFHRILQEAPTPLSQVCPGLDSRIVAIVERCLQKSPDDRYPDLEAMRRELTTLRRELDTEVAPMPAAPGRAGAVRRPPSEEVLRQRQQLIERHLTRAREALSQDDLAGVLSACREALILDPENADASALHDRAEGLSRARECVREAQQQLERGALTAASLLAQRALDIDPSLQEALAVRAAVDEARKALEARERQARAIEDALARARAHVQSRAFDLALPAIEEAESLGAPEAETAPLRRACEDGLAARQREEAEARARSVVASAERRFADGDYDAALAVLAAHTPPHPFVQQALAALEAERREILRRAGDSGVTVSPSPAAGPPAAEETRLTPAPVAPPVDADVTRQTPRPEASSGSAPTALSDPALALPQTKLSDPAIAPPQTVAPSSPAAGPAAMSASAAAAVQTRAGEGAAVAETFMTPSPMPATTVGSGVPATVSTVPPTSASTTPRGIAGIAVPETDSVASRLAAVPRWWWAAAAGIVAVIAVIVWLATGDRTVPPAAPAGPATVAFDIRPWAQIQQITLKATGAAVDVACPATPCLVALAPGEYHVVARNPFLTQPLEFDVVVPAEPYVRVSRAMPDLSPESDARRLLEGR